MKKLYIQFSILLMTASTQSLLKAQCGSQVVNGTASNMFTQIRNGTNPIAVDKDLNMILFVHRNDAGAFGGNSGQLRYDISTNAGTTWTLNQGPINSASNNLARYPNGIIYNPTSNTNPSNAYVAYMAPTINTSSAWNGIVTGVKQIGSSVFTESQNQNGIGTTLLPHSLTKGAPGVMWATEYLSSYTGYNIYQGIWSSTANDFVWSINTVISPSFYSGAIITDYNIAFDPSGLIGYFSFLGHVTGGPTNAGLYPVLYKTVDGGANWTGPIQVDLNTLGCITSNTTTGVPSTNTEHDLVVDVNGIPHILTTVGNATSYNFNYGAWHHMFDITMRNGMWVAHDLGNVNGAPNTFGISPDIAVQWQAPQAARTKDGTKLFFTWTDNSNYTLGQTNSTPNLFGKGYNVTLSTWTPTKDFTACNSAINGKILFPQVAKEVLEPSSNVYKLATVYGEPATTNNLLLTANFNFIDNVTFASSEFSIAVPSATVTIAQGPNLIYCPGSIVNINVVNGGQVIWSNGSTSNPLAISTGSIASYSVAAQANCLTGTASIAVSNLTLSAGAVTPSVCPGQTANFTVTGNALSYSWTPGTSTGTSVTFVPTSNTINLTAMGSSSCTVTSTVGITILAKPTISITGKTTVCLSETTLSLTATGGTAYAWSDGSTGAVYNSSVVPTLNVIGTGANSCTNSANVNITINPNPTLLLSSTTPSLCEGGSANLSVLGANSYSWNGILGGQTSFISPLQTTTYSVTGANQFSCESTKTIEIVVVALPVLTVTPSKANVCRGDRITLTATGASNYTWMPLGASTPSIFFTATNAQNYNFIINMSTPEGCSRTSTFVLVTKECTGIDENIYTSSSLMIYPNPNAGAFQVKGNSLTRLVITNELGQTVKTLSLSEENNFSASVNDLAGGIYFVTGKSQEGIIKQKIIINR